MSAPKTPLLLLGLLIIALSQLQPEQLLVRNSVTITQPQLTTTYFTATLPASQIDMAAISIIPPSSFSDFLQVVLSVQPISDLQRPPASAALCSVREPATCFLALDSTRQLYLLANSQNEVIFTIFIDLAVSAPLPDRVSFSTYQTAIYQIDGEQFNSKSQISVAFTYQRSSITMQHFSVAAARNQYPKSSTHTNFIASETVGAYSKVLTLPSITPESQYIIVVTSPLDNPLTITAYQTKPPLLPLNSTLLYFSTGSHNHYVTSLSITQPPQHPLTLDMGFYAGVGSISVNYCRGMMDWTYSPNEVNTAQAQLTTTVRQLCRERQLQQNSVNTDELEETVSITIEEDYQLAYGLTLQQRQNTIDTLAPHFRIYSLLTPSNAQHQYYITSEANVQHTINFAQYNPPNGTLIFTVSVESCQLIRGGLTTNCTTIKEISNEESGVLTFTPLLGATYRAAVVAGFWTEGDGAIDADLTYHIELNIPTTSSLLQPYQPLLQQVVERKTYRCYKVEVGQYYRANEWNWQTATATLSVDFINGQISVFLSSSTPCPKSSNIQQNTTTMNVFGVAQLPYSIATSDVLYASVLGTTQSLYNLEITFDPVSEEPSSYVSLPDNQPKKFEANESSLIRYEPHIRPYLLDIKGEYNCLQIGSTLPLSSQCSDLPHEWDYSMVYLKISHPETSITVQAVVFTLSLTSIAPLWINCDYPCWATVRATLLTASAIMHSHNGVLTYQGANYTENAPIDNISCLEYPCSIVFKAQPTGDSLYIWLKESNIIVSSILEQAISFKGPQYIIYPLRQWQIFNSLLVHSPGVSITAYTKILSNNKTSSSSRAISFPSLIDPVQHSNPLKNTMAVTVSSEQLSASNCNYEKEVNCILTVTIMPDTTRIFSPYSLSNSKAHVSGNTYQRRVKINQPLNVYEEGIAINYIGCNTSQYDENDFVVSITPLSHCAPAIYPYNQPNSDIPTYSTLVMTPINGWLNFTLLNQQPCNYVIMVTNANGYPVVQNMLYSMTVGEEENLNLVFRSQYTPAEGYNIILQPDSGMVTPGLLVNKAQNDKQIIMPTLDNAQFQKYQSNSIWVDEEEIGGLYLISVIAPAGTQYTLMIRKNTPIVLNHAQLINPIDWPWNTSITNTTQQFRVSALGQWILQVTTLDRVEVAVRTDQNTSIIAEATFTPNSTSHTVDQYSSLATFDLTLTATTLNYTIQFLQAQLQLMPMLEGGMVQGGVFMYPTDSYCYRHISEDVVGILELTFDLIWGHPMSDGAVPLLMVDGVEEQVDQSWVNDRVQRVVAPFHGGALYILCYTPNGLSILNQPYEVLLHQPYLPVLTPQESTTVESPAQLTPYQLIQSQNKPLLVQLTACQQSSDKTLRLAYNYAEKSKGNYGQISTTTRNHNSYVQLDQQQGYIYLAVQSTDSSPYRIQARELNSGEKLRATEWSLSATELDAPTQEGDAVSVKMPPINTSTDETGFVSVSYTAYLADLDNYDSSYTLEAMARCPDLFFGGPTARQQVPAGVTIASATYHYSSPPISNEDSPYVILPTALPDNFNLTGKVTVRTNSQVLHYYYSNSNPPPEGSSNKPFYISIFVVILLAAAVGGFLCYRSMKKKKQSERERDEFERSVEMGEVGSKSQPHRDHRIDLLTGQSSRTERKDAGGYTTMMEEL